MVNQNRIFLRRVLPSGTTDFIFLRSLPILTPSYVDYLGDEIDQGFRSLTISNLSGKEMICSVENDVDNAIVLSAVGGDGMFMVDAGMMFELSDNIIERLRIWVPSNNTDLELILES